MLPLALTVEDRELKIVHSITMLPLAKGSFLPAKAFGKWLAEYSAIAQFPRQGATGSMAGTDFETLVQLLARLNRLLVLQNTRSSAQLSDTSKNSR